MGIESDIRDVRTYLKEHTRDIISLAQRVEALENYAQVHRQQISEIVETLEVFDKELKLLRPKK